VDTTQVFAFCAVFGVGFLAALVTTPLAARFGRSFDMVDVPGGRRQHSGAIPRTGGLAIFIAFTLAAIVAQLMPVERTDSEEIIRFTGLILGGTLIYAVGLLDDKFQLSALWQYVGQLGAAAIAVLFLIFIETFNNPFTGNTSDPFPYWITVTISLMWMGLMMNTVNLLDGSDGLATGVGCIAALMIFIHAAFRLDQVSVGLLALAMVGATLGFLPYNFHPARIFLGGGAHFLGFVLGVLSIIGGAKIATILLVMGLPLMDAAWQAASRLLRGQNPLEGDRGHLHYRLMDAGISPRTIAIGYYIFCALFGIVALTTASRLFKLITLGVLVLIVIAIFLAMSLRKNKGA
jgi:UDP-GlcNAc:undecaprenyl-phosphate GlcNAc-1-phosphate transferase